MLFLPSPIINLLLSLFQFTVTPLLNKHPFNMDAVLLRTVTPLLLKCLVPVSDRCRGFLLCNIIYKVWLFAGFIVYFLQ